MCQQLLGVNAVQAKPGLVPIAAPVGPAFVEAELFGDTRKIGDGEIRIADSRCANGIVRPGRGRLEIINVVAQTPKAHSVLHRLPGYSWVRLAGDIPENDDAQGSHVDESRLSDCSSCDFSLRHSIFSATARL